MNNPWISRVLRLHDLGSTTIISDLRCKGPLKKSTNGSTMINHPQNFWFMMFMNLGIPAIFGMIDFIAMVDTWGLFIFPNMLRIGD